MVVQIEQIAQLGGETLGVLEVLHAQRAAADFVFIGRADTATGGTDFFATALLTRGFSRHIECRMKRQNQGTGFADAQARAQLYASLLQARHLFQQLGHRQDHAIADVATDSGAHDAAGDQMQSGFDAVDHQRMAGVVTALETHHSLGTFRQPVHQLALAFVAPLGSDHDDVSARFLIHVLFYKVVRVQPPDCSTSARSQWNSSTSLSWPGRTHTTV